MIMLKLFMRRQFTGHPATSYDRRDPLAHPEIRRMTPRELADLPLSPR
jgi:hypothetical protein